MSAVTRATISPGSRYPGATVSWLNPGNDPNGGAALAAGVGAMVFSHLTATHVYYLLDNGAGIRSLTTDVGVPCPAGASALAIHLDRLWLMEANTHGLAKCWYTDPFNLDSIRTTNVIGARPRPLSRARQWRDRHVGRRRISFSCQNSIYVLDGDPQLGGACGRISGS